MAGLSIERRRKAWLQGVAFGATGKNWARLEVPKLLEIYQRGAEFGRANLETPYVRAVVAQQKARVQVSQQSPPRPSRPFRPGRPGDRPRRGNG